MLSADLSFLALSLPILPLWAATVLELALAGCLGLLAHVVITTVIRRVLHRTYSMLGDIMASCITPPLRVAFPVLAIALARLRTRWLEEEAPPITPVDQIIQIAVIAVLTWLIIASVGAVVTFIKRRHPLNVPDNREARRVHTQVSIVGRTLQVVLIFLGISAALLTFPLVQQLGTSLLASAGIAGIVIGFAARPVLENLIAGIQIGLTQPIRLDDVVIVEGEWGRIEEITLTYVVVRVWDDRRLVLPFNKFISEPFQNWTRNNPQITGTIFLHVDYAADIARIREKAREIVQSLPGHDGRVFALQVTDATERTLQIRVLVSARDAGGSWENRVAVREQLLAWMRQEMPEALPRTRVELPSENKPSPAG